MSARLDKQIYVAIFVSEESVMVVRDHAVGVDGKRPPDDQAQSESPTTTGDNDLPTPLGDPVTDGEDVTMNIDSETNGVH
eukprot:3667773-Karenia_brevis.AAC.1